MNIKISFPIVYIYILGMLCYIHKARSSSPNTAPFPFSKHIQLILMDYHAIT